jgi:hypothetical protein
MDGVRIDLISHDRLSTLSSHEKVALVLSLVRQGTIVVLEDGLSPEEQADLIEMTMTKILPGEFSGIEVETYPTQKKARGYGVFSKLVRTAPSSRLTVIGPANQLRTIRREPDIISAWVSSQIEG